MPGQEFTGPGTHITEKILGSVQPSNYTDFVTMMHDIDYLRYYDQPVNILLSDLKAIKEADFDIPGAVTKIGLSAKILSGHRFDRPLYTSSGEELTPEQTRAVGSELYSDVVRNENYANYFKKYGL